MRVKEVQQLLDLELVAGSSGLDRVVEDGYCGDLLSDVMANAPRGGVWLTVQGHQNIIAVAVLRELAAIILVNGSRPDPKAIEKGEEEGIPLLVTDKSAYEMAGRLYKAGLGQTKDEAL